jgi:hypothetical protein
MFSDYLFLLYWLSCGLTPRRGPQRAVALGLDAGSWRQRRSSDQAQSLLSGKRPHIHRERGVGPAFVQPPSRMAAGRRDRCKQGAEMLRAWVIALSMGHRSPVFQRVQITALEIFNLT